MSIISIILIQRIQSKCHNIHFKLKKRNFFNENENVKSTR
jgi:hypothetical protein